MHTIYEGRGNHCPASLLPREWVERLQIGRIAGAAHGGALVQHIKALGSFSSTHTHDSAVDLSGLFENSALFARWIHIVLSYLILHYLTTS